MADKREVRIPIGKRSYLLQTELDDDALNRVVAIVNEIGRAIADNLDQDNMLMLVCLQLAYNLEKVSGLLETLDKRLSDIDPRDVK